MKSLRKHVVLWIILLIPYAGLFFVYHRYNSQLEAVANASVILISKQEKQLRLINFRGDELMCVPVAVGMNPGNKIEKGDMKTPEGIFSISDIQHSSNWKHDFGDGEGEIQGAYGPYFIRLNTPGHKGIGIHGTHLPSSLGTRVSEGCIRMDNTDLERLVPLISLSTVVIITPGTEDLEQ
ncbi:MAG: L,D-transpeptidase [Tannerella sp.]|jgi:lipoprotein-anchoring transpeptidase ErfK/SrfK|nr:L,D-transpeptidase [Tannerella sp.]